MRVADEIAKQIESAATGAPWYGPPLATLLDGLDAKSAALHPLAGAHSIWEVVLHLISIQALVLERCGGENARFIEADAWPMPDRSEDERWLAAREGVLAGEVKIAVAAKAFMGL